MTNLQTARLNLRPFSDDDLDNLAALMPNEDFFRGFSTIVFGISRDQRNGR